MPAGLYSYRPSEENSPRLYAYGSIGLGAVVCRSTTSLEWSRMPSWPAPHVAGSVRNWEQADPDRVDRHASRAPATADLGNMGQASTRSILHLQYGREASPASG